MTTSPIHPGADTTVAGSRAVASPDAVARAAGAAAAATAVLPAVSALTVCEPQALDANLLGQLAGAVVAQLSGSSDQIAVLVAGDLVAALGQSPLPGLDLAAAVQPALDAAASSLGFACDNGREVSVDLVSTELAAPVVAVPLVGTALSAALLVPLRIVEPADATVGAAAFTPTVGSTGLAAPTVAAGGPSTVAAHRPAMEIPRGLELLHGVEMDLTVELGRTRMAVRDLLALSPGDVLELDRAAGSPADLLVNGRLIARGEVVVVDEDFGLRITEIIDAAAS